MLCDMGGLVFVQQQKNGGSKCRFDFMKVLWTLEGPGETAG